MLLYKDITMSPSTKKIIELSSVVLVSFTVGLAVAIYFLPKTTQQLSQEIRKNYNYKFINPLLECNNSNISTNKNLTTLQKSIEFIINQETGNSDITFASVYYRDLNNGPWFGINEKEYFSPASLIKVPVMMAYLKAAEDDPSILQKKIMVTKPFDYSEQNITPTQTLQVDHEYTVDELISRMVIYSDNAAYELLIDNIDNAKIYQVYQDLDVDISKAQEDPNGNIITVSDYSSFFRILFNASYLDQEMSEKALSLLSKSEYVKGLVAGVPNNITVAHKFGERQFLPSHEKQLHDCGIVYLPNQPYLLCVMTRGNDFDKLAKFISEVSKTVYNGVSTNPDQ